MGEAAGREQLAICTRDCGARCCRYVTIKVSAPRSRDDWDEMRWWLAHTGVSVSKDDEGWMVCVETRCGNLRADNTCAVHPQHMDTCKDYDPAHCEFTGPLDEELELRSELDLALYLERRKLKRGAAVARAIRRAERRRKKSPPGPLVALRGLGPAARRRGTSAG